jgi:hypothetical protein
VGTSALVVVMGAAYPTAPDAKHGGTAPAPPCHSIE